MRDFPVFTTENGVGSLIFRDVPYWGNAYIKIQDTRDGNKFLSECVDFCRAVGAEHIYGLEHPAVSQYPFYSSVIKMTASADQFLHSDCSLFPVTAETGEQWRKIYNDKMRNIPNASYMDGKRCLNLIQKGEAYFLHQNGELAGIGAIGDDSIQVVISLKKGMGRQIVNALAEILAEDTINLEVSSQNEKAISLYESMGFMKVRELSRWYKIL